MDGLCTHEEVHLADGLVIEYSIECPKHASLFDHCTGDVETSPACEDRKTHAINVENGNVMIERAMKERHCLEKQRRDGAKTP